MAMLSPNSAGKDPWWLWPVVIVAIEIFWFGQLYPLVPQTLVGAAILAALPLPVAAYIYVAVKCLSWISDRSWPYWIRRGTGMAVAISVGVVIFGIILVAVEMRRGDFGYRSFSGR
jgi:hypothetical protein